MKVSITGDAVTPERIKESLEACEQQYGLKLKGATIYLRFEDHLGRTVEPICNGREVSRSFHFWKPKPPIMRTAKVQETKPAPADPITAKGMYELCQKHAHRCLSAPEMSVLISLEKNASPGKAQFVRALELTLEKAGYFNAKNLEQTLKQILT